MSAIRILLAASVVGVIACGGGTRESGLEIETTDSTVKAPAGDRDAQTSGNPDNGTSLTATATPGDVTCDGQSGGTVPISGIVTSIGSVDSVAITASVDGGAPNLVGTILPQDFKHDGRIKTANYSVQLSLGNGTFPVTLCFIQSGSQGREPKRFCLTITITVSCANSCAGTGFFGNLVGNKNLCAGNGPPHIPVHVKGDLGDAPSLSITGPNGYGHSATMNRSGESCVYQYNWNTKGNGGAGTYTFTVSGNQKTYSFQAQLHCNSHLEE